MTPLAASQAAPRYIPVVCALIEDAAGRVLVAQRPPHKHLGLKWEFPGGKLEPGETPEAALHRELQEELGCRVELLHALPRSSFAYAAVNIEMIPYIARLLTPVEALAPTEHVALRWVAPVELTTLDLPEADIPIVAAYLEYRK